MRQCHFHQICFDLNAASVDLANRCSAPLPERTDNLTTYATICAKSIAKISARVAELADAPDLGSGGEIRRGSSPLPGSFPRIKSCGKTRLLSRAWQCNNSRYRGRSWHLMACILVVRGTAIATVTSGLFSALALPKSIFLHFVTKRSPRNQQLA